MILYHLRFSWSIPLNSPFKGLIMGLRLKCLKQDFSNEKYLQGDFSSKIIVNNEATLTKETSKYVKPKGAIVFLNFDVFLNV